MTATTEPTERLTYSMKEFAEMMGVSYPHVSELIAEGKVPGVIRLGRRVLILKSAVDQMLKEAAAN
jgi:excisionase family DNA binding protein